MTRATLVLTAGLGSILGAALWWRKHPSACPYGQRDGQRVIAQAIANIEPRQGDARELPYDDATFDAAYLVTVLGEVPDQDAAVRELRRVLKPGGRVVVGELFGDPHMVGEAALRRRASLAGLRFERRVGPRFGFFAVLRPEGPPT